MRYILAVCAMLFGGCVCGSVDSGYVGVVKDMGRVEPTAVGPGFYAYPITKSVVEIDVRQQTVKHTFSCFSSDLQEVKVSVTAMYAIPAPNAPTIVAGYSGDVAQTLLVPRLAEALKEATADLTAEQLAKQRETVKRQVFDVTKRKVGTILEINDVVIDNVDISERLQEAIEAKMVMEQQAASARFESAKRQIEAETKLAEAKTAAEAEVARAKGQAESIRIRGEALRANPSVIEFSLVEKWNGVTPTTVFGGDSKNVLLPLR